MTFYFIGSEDLDFVCEPGVQSLSSAPVVGAGPMYRSDFSRSAITVPGGALYYATAIFSQPLNEMWITWQCTNLAILSTGYVRPWITLSNGLSNPVLQVLPTGATTTSMGFFRYNGTNATTMAVTVPLQSDGVLTRYDMYLKYDTAGAIKVWQNQNLVTDFSGDTTSPNSSANTGIDRISFHNPASTFTGATNHCYSEVIVADEDTRTMSVCTHTITNTGNRQEWTGNITDINEVSLDNANFIYSTATDQVSDYVLTDLPTNQNFVVRAFQVSAKASRGLSGGQHIQLGTYANGTSNTFSYNFAANSTVTTGWETIKNIFTVNPNTGLPFTKEQINATNLAVKAKD